MMAHVQADMQRRFEVDDLGEKLQVKVSNFSRQRVFHITQCLDRTQMACLSAIMIIVLT